MKKYDVIYADPPWSYRDKSKKKGGAERHYNTMSLKELKLLDVEAISSENCILFMWATFPNMREALDLIFSWGFNYKTVGFNWVKRNKVSDTWFWGMGSYTRSNSEVCLIATKGKPLIINRGVHSVLDSRVMRHSKKPNEARCRIEKLMGEVNKIELFAREKAEGWDYFGDEIEGGVKINKTTPAPPIVIVESPYAGNLERNIRYARAAISDCLKRGEAPYASHLLYTQKDVLDDTIKEQRDLGMRARFAFSKAAETAVVYADFGITKGMKEGIFIHKKNGLKIEKRKIL